MKKDVILLGTAVILVQCLLSGCVALWGEAEPERAEPVFVERMPVQPLPEKERSLPPYQRTTDAFYASLNSILQLANLSVRDSVAEVESDVAPADEAGTDMRITAGPLRIEGTAPCRGDSPLQESSSPQKSSPAMIVRKTPPKPPGPTELETRRGTPPEDLFQSAFYLFHEMDYEKGRKAFRTFLDRYPNDSLTDSAQYWIGECYYAQHLYREAGEAFRKVLTRFNSSDKFADAFFKTGLCYHRLNASEKSKEYWERLIQRYPDSRAADLARRFIRKSAV